ncbi:DNA-processing protein DprA [Pediococcus stilesii]|uniref:Rossmann fold nucleotide-binding protein for DNA uptake n=1 Tax=Pediococcus stilesii TaxID=331679 RepID=A0A0R2L8W7_9LACO|nr:DNA-processing protein DprA [Pediococcus stilesii]KRN95175.1 Rossmann fold nucleotide-binding protein for DNA uptake [Pediococcus stilesii]
MEVRDFLIRIKIGTTFNIKKQHQIYKEVNNVTSFSASRWVTTTNLIENSQKDATIKMLHSEQLKRKVKENEQNGGIITILDAAYPAALKEIFCPPTVIFYRGNVTLLNQTRLVAIVGSRVMTDYGKQAVKCLIPGLVGNQLVTVSGLAKGVDAMVHLLTLNSAGATIAVVGNGLDVTYPKQNQILQSQIEKRGILISEYPKGARPLRHHFVERNRIIAGLAKATCVVEAKKQSGSLITANLALNENRNVLAIPGSIFSENSNGTNALIAAGARPLVELADILEEV